MKWNVARGVGAALLLPLLPAGCMDWDPVAPSGIPGDGLLIEAPRYSVVDPGAEVNTSITVTPLVCSETGTVTVSLAGVRPPPADVPLDLMLVLDESGSISAAQWEQVRQASLSLLARLDAADGAQDGVLTNIRIGVIKFATNATYNLPLTGNYNLARNFLMNTPRESGWTNITAALDLARFRLQVDGLPNSAKAVVFMTDGVATRGGTTDAEQIASAAAVKALPARLFVVGVGQVNAPLLQTMASPGDFVLMSDFDDLGDAFDDIATQALVFPAAKDLTFSADVPAGFTLVPGSASASKGTATEGAGMVSWSIAELLDETVTLTYQIQHDVVAAPAGGTLTAVTNAQLALTTPVSNNSYSESFADETTEVTACDTTPPEITPVIAGTLGDNGWYVSDIAISWLVVDNESPITAQSGCDPATVDTDTPAASFTCSATSAGGSASETVAVKRDATAPTVSYAGNAGSYDVNDAVNITCSAADNLSGLASTTCSDITGAAWSFALGANAFSATATDHAGNVGSGATSFVVTVGFDSLCTLVRDFVAQRGIADSLCAKLSAAGASAGRGNTTAMRNQLNSFINEVGAQSGSHMPADRSALLIALARALM
jgi:uncharacterized protein YegL